MASVETLPVVSKVNCLVQVPLRYSFSLTWCMSTLLFDGDLLHVPYVVERGWSGIPSRKLSGCLLKNVRCLPVMFLIFLSTRLTKTWTPDIYDIFPSVSYSLSAL